MRNREAHLIICYDKINLSHSCHAVTNNNHMQEQNLFHSIGFWRDNNKNSRWTSQNAKPVQKRFIRFYSAQHTSETASCHSCHSKNYNDYWQEQDLLTFSRFPACPEIIVSECLPFLHVMAINFLKARTNFFPDKSRRKTCARKMNDEQFLLLLLVFWLCSDSCWHILVITCDG